MELTHLHREILQAIGFSGASWSQLKGVGMGREFDDLRHAGLIVYWPQGEPRPLAAVATDGYAGYWYLTIEGASAAGLELPPLRLS